MVLTDMVPTFHAAPKCEAAVRTIIQESGLSIMYFRPLLKLLGLNQQLRPNGHIALACTSHPYDIPTAIERILIVGN